MKNFSKQINDYLLGRLTQLEREQFEMQMKNDPAFARKVELNRELSSSVYEDDIFALREKLKISQKKTSAPRSKRIQFVALATAASLALIITLRFLLIDSSMSHDKIFETHFQPYQVVGESRSSEDDVDKLIPYELSEPYIKKNYNDAIPVLESYLAKYPNDFQASLMLSSSYLEINRAEKAEIILGKVLENNPNEFYTEITKWYLALSLVKQERLEEAKFLLAEIEKGGGFYSNKASLIIQSL